MTNPIEHKASEPKRVQVDGVSVEQHPLKDQLEADRYLEAKKAAKKKLGIRIVKLSPPGAE